MHIGCWLAPASVVTLDFTARLMSSLIVPLLILFFPVLFHHLTFNREKKIGLQLFSWGALVFLFVYYVLLFLLLELVILTRNPDLAFGISFVVSMATFVVIQLFFKNIIAIYREAEPDNSYWKKGKLTSSIPYILGILLIGLIVLVSIVPLW